jgi:hypothetical protein
MIRRCRLDNYFNIGHHNLKIFHVGWVSTHPETGFSKASAENNNRSDTGGDRRRKEHNIMELDNSWARRMAEDFY